MKYFIIFLMFICSSAFASDEISAAKIFANCIVKSQKQNHFALKNGGLLVQSCLGEYHEFLRYCENGRSLDECEYIGSQGVHAIMIKVK